MPGRQGDDYNDVQGHGLGGTPGSGLWALGPRRRGLWKGRDMGSKCEHPLASSEALTNEDAGKGRGSLDIQSLRWGHALQPPLGTGLIGQSCPTAPESRRSTLSSHGHGLTHCPALLKEDPIQGYR